MTIAIVDLFTFFLVLYNYLKKMTFYFVVNFIIYSTRRHYEFNLYLRYLSL